MAMRQTDPEIIVWANEDDRRQAEWDRKCEAAPKCDCCGESVYPFDKYLTFDDETFYCERCVSRHTYHTETLEV